MNAPTDSTLSAEAVRFHADQIRVNGYTVLPGTLPVDLISRLRDAFDLLLDRHRDAHPTNRGANRYQMYLPFEEPFATPQLYERPDVLAVVGAALGERFHLGYFASDTPYPGSDYQAVHPDSEQLFPEESLAVPPFALVLNVPLVDVTEENGPLEFWPGGTHHFPTGVDVQRLAAAMVSQRLTHPAGSILLRDPRAWHRGTPNRGTRSRPNLALVYHRPWYRFALEGPTLRRSQYDALSPTGKSLLRFATVQED